MWLSVQTLVIEVRAPISPEPGRLLASSQVLIMGGQNRQKEPPPHSLKKNNNFVNFFWLNTAERIGNAETVFRGQTESSLMQWGLMKGLK